MTDAVVLGRLRRFLLLLAAALCLGTFVELALSEHTETAMQILPFVLAGLGLLALLALLWRRSRATLLGLRAVMLGLGLGGALGVWQHFAANLAFELEIRPGATAAAVLPEALRGASPLLAPGILAVIAALALAATYGLAPGDAPPGAA